MTIRADIYLQGGGRVPIKAATVQELSDKIQRLEREVLAESIIEAARQLRKVTGQRDALTALVERKENER